jgi:hypothetical protein
VPEVGLEPTRSKGTLDFESRASTNSTTPAPERFGPVRWSTFADGNMLSPNPGQIIVPTIGKVKVRKSLTPISKGLYFALSLEKVGP